jgi:hypothetical protein
MTIENSLDLAKPYKRGMREGERTVGLSNMSLNLQECPGLQLRHVVENGFAVLRLCATMACLRCHTG